MLQKHLGSTVRLLTASPSPETLHHISVHLGNQAGPVVSHCRCSLASSHLLVWSSQPLTLRVDHTTSALSLSKHNTLLCPLIFVNEKPFAHTNLNTQPLSPHSSRMHPSLCQMPPQPLLPACLYVLRFTPGPSPPHGHPPWLSACSHLLQSAPWLSPSLNELQ